jgi:hypothetical protein
MHLCKYAKNLKKWRSVYTDYVLEKNNKRWYNKGGVGEREQSEASSKIRNKRNGRGIGMSTTHLITLTNWTTFLRSQPSNTSLFRDSSRIITSLGVAQYKLIYTHISLKDLQSNVLRFTTHGIHRSGPFSFGVFTVASFGDVNQSLGS